MPGGGGLSRGRNIPTAPKPSGQITSRSVSDADYTSHPGALSLSYSVNGLNQYTAVGGTSMSYSDNRGNLTGDGSRNFTYDSLNRLLSGSAPTSVVLTYDAAGRLGSTTASSTVTRYLYVGPLLIAELDGSGAVLRRYVPDPETDVPLVWYEGPGLMTRQWLNSDDLGNVIGYSDGSAVAGGVTGYGPFGETASWTGLRLKFTAQATVPEGLFYYFRARAYDPGTGRFLQPDPSGIDGGLNLYSYASNDPINRVDLTGLLDEATDMGDLLVMGRRSQPPSYCDVNPNVCDSFRFNTMPASGTFSYAAGGSAGPSGAPAATNDRASSSEEFYQCVGRELGTDGTFVGVLLFGLGLGSVSAPIIPKPRGGMGGSIPTTSAMSIAARRAQGANAMAPDWLVKLGNYAWPGRTSPKVGGNIARIGSGSGQIISGVTIIESMQTVQKAMKKCGG